MSKMKKLLVGLYLLLHVFIAEGQKHDNVWLFGYGSNDINLNFGGTVLEFTEDTINTYYEYRDMWFDFTNTSMCDSMGNLLFYTNGIAIWNSLNEIMENGEGLSPGLYADAHQQTGMYIPQGVLPLPKAFSDSLYYLIHIDMDYPGGGLSYHTQKMYYSLIDMSKNNGRGAVIEKNQIILEDILASRRVTACQHANGIDWWIIMKKYHGGLFYKVLLTESGFEVSEQSIGEYTYSNSAGQAVFSPDGTKYVRQQMVSMDIGNFLNIYDFDRCTGLLSNPIQIAYADSAWSGGVAISPNSRFLYVSSYEYVYQFDLWADDIESSKDTVAIYDGWHYGNDPNFRSTFFLMQLGPDGKIYISANNSIPYLHVINNPDLPGDSCNVCQHCVELPTFNAFSMPNFPNYRLGAAAEPCVPDAVDEPGVPDMKVSVYPNPAKDKLTVEWGKSDFEKGSLAVYDLFGKQIISFDLVSGSNTFVVELNHFFSGVYFIQVKLDDEQPLIQKVVVHQ